MKVLRFLLVSVATLGIVLATGMLITALCGQHLIGLDPGEREEDTTDTVFDDRW